VISVSDSQEQLLRTARIRRDKVLKFSGRDEEGAFITWYTAYRGKYGWSACRGTGQWADSPTDDEVEAAFDVYDEVELLDRSETPDEVEL
jgi:hypothetical protein